MYKKNPTNVKVYRPNHREDTFGYNQDYFYMIFDTEQPCSIELKCTFTLKVNDIEKQLELEKFMKKK